MKTKLFEIRDRGTFIPALAIQVRGADGYLLRRAGFGSPLVYLVKLETQQCAYSPYNWPGGCRTMQVAHRHIEKYFDELKSGEVVDVEFILGETGVAKLSEEIP